MTANPRRGFLVGDIFEHAARAVPDRTAGYSGTPLLTKLGIREGHLVLLSGAPAGA